MTLSARIPLRPSGRIALLETGFPTVGFVVAATTLAARWPGAAAVIGGAATIAVVVTCILAARRWRRRRTWILNVSAHPDVGVTGSEDAWRIAEPSLVRPGFSVLALWCDAPRAREALVVPVFDADLAPADRRALHRFLGWCQRGGATIGRS